MESYIVINFDHWERKEVFDFFKNYQDPYFNVTVNIEVTELWLQCKMRKKSFFLSSLFLACKAINDLPDFRVRNSGNEIREYSVVHPGCTVLKADNSFGFAYFTMEENLDAFCDKGLIEIERVKALKGLGADDHQLDIVYFSVLPWMSFTSFKNARMDNALNGIPKIVFGKVFQAGADLYQMPVSIEVHHSFLDGFHVGQFVSHFEKLIRTENS